MINYQTRHTSPIPAFVGNEEQFLGRLRQTPPDYMVWLSRDLSEFGVGRFGAEGNPGNLILKWAVSNYTAIAARGGDIIRSPEPGIVVLQRKPAAGATTDSPAPGK
jgi:hypothetical protein